MKVKFLFKWYDFWVGLFWDRKGRILYIFPVPTLGVSLAFNKENKVFNHLLELSKQQVKDIRNE